jgi:hypothetical protein
MGMEELQERIEQLQHQTAASTNQESTSEPGDEGSSSSKKA